MNRRDHDPFAPHDEPDFQVVEADGIEKVGIELPADGKPRTVKPEGQSITTSVKPAAKPKAKRKPAAKPKEKPHVRR